MDVLGNLLARVETLNDGLRSGTIVGDVIRRHPGDIMDYQRRQLFAGLASSGEDIRPYYSEDIKPGGYFDNKADAAKYAAWKQELRYPYEANRNPDAPNLYINGKFHSELDVDFGSEAVAVVGGTPYAKGIVAKYGLATFGLMMANWMAIFVERGAYEELMTEVKTILYGR